MCVLFDFNQFIFTAAHAHFYSVFQAAFPVGVRVGIGEVVVVAMFFFRQNAAFDDRLTVDRIGNMPGRVQPGQKRQTYQCQGRLEYRFRHGSRSKEKRR